MFTLTRFGPCRRDALRKRGFDLDSIQMSNETQQTKDGERQLNPQVLRSEQAAVERVTASEVRSPNTCRSVW